MSTLHGSWIITSEGSYFFLWSENWRTISNSNANPKDDASEYPFDLTLPELITFATSYNLTPTLGPRSAIVTLPSYKVGKGKAILPVLSNQPQEELPSIIYHRWQIQGGYLEGRQLLEFFAHIPLGKNDHIGDDITYWLQIYRWSRDLLARGKFLPGVGYWQVLLDSDSDQTYLGRLTRFMPSICGAYSDVSPQQLILSCLTTLVDMQLRRFITTNPPNERIPTLQKWLQSLQQSSPNYNLENPRLANSLHTWTFPLQEYLVNPLNYHLKTNLYRTCFILTPSERDDVQWQLKYYLQALDDSEFLLDASEIWQYPVEELHWQGRIILNPQETLLKGLGLASRIYSPISNSLHESQPDCCTLDPIEVYQFLKVHAWQLQDHGLGVILPPGLAQQRLGIKIQAEVSAKPGERLGLQTLLNYQLQIAVGDHIISQEELEKILAKKSPFVQINGQWMALQPGDVAAAQSVFNKRNEPIVLSVEDALRLQAGEIQVIAKLPIVGFEASGQLSEFIQSIVNRQSLQLVPVPDTFIGELRPYQHKGVSWLVFLEKWGLGACLADDMGLGKTIQLIAFLLYLKAENYLQKPVLLVAPTSVLSNWQREVKKFGPSLQTILYHGDKRPQNQEFIQAITGKDVVITSYSLVYRDEVILAQVQWQGLVLDEAQNIKNSQAKQSQTVSKLSAGFKIALTGTPVENRLTELWSIMNFLNPGFLGNRQYFQKVFAIPIEKYGERQASGKLRSLIAPFILRRLKSDRDIIQDLPEKQEMNVFCDLSLEQAQIYKQLVESSLVAIDGTEGIKRRGMILTLLMQLKQLCNHPALFLKEDKIVEGSSSGKLLRLEEMLEEVIAESDRALIFTQFAQWGQLLQPYLREKFHKEVLFLYGGNTRQQRQEMIDRFQNDPNGPHIFILSLKAGGTGVNLTRANHVFHIDRWWNPAVENQATDRAFRIGQKRHVQVHKFICVGTLEERINDMIESKKSLAEQTVESGESWLTELNTDQLRDLLLLT